MTHEAIHLNCVIFRRKTNKNGLLWKEKKEGAPWSGHSYSNHLPIQNDMYTSEEALFVLTHLLWPYVIYHSIHENTVIHIVHTLWTWTEIISLKATIQTQKCWCWQKSKSLSALQLHLQMYLWMFIVSFKFFVFFKRQVLCKLILNAQMCMGE